MRLTLTDNLEEALAIRKRIEDSIEKEMNVATKSFIFNGQDAQYVVYWHNKDGQLDPFSIVVKATLGNNDVTDDLYADIISEMCDMAWDECKKMNMEIK
jgi:hypothetical protein